MKNQNPKHINVCIPAHRELGILDTLESLKNCSTEGLIIKVYIFINGSSEDGRVSFDSNMQVLGLVESWIEEYEGDIEFLSAIDLHLPEKHAGVGLARKILGDTALSDFEDQEIDGIIVYLDADCTVDRNYFQAIHSFFASSAKKAAAIHYEHQIVDAQEDFAIIEYETHLRYYILMQEYVGLPFAIHTVGSSMAVFSSSYKAKGGMNRRKAGEDFYFLQKFIKDGICGKIIDTCVHPSARKSDRVPFGTGRAMLAYEDETLEWQTYHPDSFKLLIPLITNLEELYQDEFDLNRLDNRLQQFLEANSFDEKIKEIRSNVSSYSAFYKRFYQFFDAFRLMKYLHYVRDLGLNDIPISQAIDYYLTEVQNIQENLSLFEALKVLRKLEKKPV